jgi:uncharacterized membrane protein
MAILLEVLLWLHIVAAIGWVGAAMVFGMLIGPALPTFTPSTRGEFVVKVVPKYTRFAQVFTVVTPIVGIALALSMSGGDMSVFAPTTQFGLFISAGAALTLVAWVVAFGVIGPAAHKVVRLTEEAMKSPGPPSPELLAANKRLRMGAASGLVLLLVILACMVAASI